MASCITTQWANTAPQVKLTVEQTSKSNTAATYTYTLQYIASSAANTQVSKTYSVYIDGEKVENGVYSIDGKTGTNTICTGTKSISLGESERTLTFSLSFDFNLTWSGVFKGRANAAGQLTVPALPTYTITFNANGGTGAPASQSAQATKVIKLSTTIPERTGYTFKGWATNATSQVVFYAAGASCTMSRNLTLFAVWQLNTYTIVYNANGGENAPASSTKKHGETLKLSTQKPTRTNYTFKGWATSSSGSAEYAAGANFAINKNTTLYAVWELAYVKPRIYNISISRCDSNGTTNDNGTSVHFKFNWECSFSDPEITIRWESKTANAGSMGGKSQGTSGAVDLVYDSNVFLAESNYDFTITVEDSHGASMAKIILPGTKYTIDVLNGGKGISFVFSFTQSAVSGCSPGVYAFTRETPDEILSCMFIFILLMCLFCKLANIWNWIFTNSTLEFF